MRRWMIGAAVAMLALLLGAGAVWAAPAAANADAHGRGGRGQGGEVARVDGSTIVVAGRDGTERSILTTASTSYEVNGAAGSLSEIAAGMFVRAEGTTADDGSFTASEVHASDERPARPEGPGRHGPGAPDDTSTDTSTDQA